MTSTTTVHAEADQLDQLLAATTGRFGRQLRTISITDPELAPTRWEMVVRMRARMQDGEYRIDPLVVADAMVGRLTTRAA